MLSQIAIYLTVVGQFARFIWLFDPYEYIDVISPFARDILFWCCNMFVFAGTTLAYAVWFEIVQNSKKVGSSFNFTIAKIACIGFVCLGLSSYLIVLFICYAIGSYEIFDFIFVIVGIIFTLMFLVVHLILLPMFSRVAKISISQKIKDIHEYINWLILFVNGITLAAGISRALLEDPLFPLSSPQRIYVTLLFDWVFRLKELLMGYWFYKIVLYKDQNQSMTSTGKTVYRM
eukprot:TRINITY_DN3954_c0_g1_i2.p1 TRINITY_DN3954_c0_g1~~TRINITY_DN3954_c0_g1_i2.p1  ORF type:complete len:232 (-),score=19.44 TRINITY_DN3954_c0_g1_i2:26-721(-)